VGELAAAATLQRFTAGEALMRQGEPGSSLIVILEGGVRVDVVPEEDRAAVTVAHRGPGDHIGEMSLLTGEPRGATVVAERETLAAVLPASAMGELLAAEPELLQGLSESLAARLIETDQRLADSASEEVARASLVSQVAERMKRFFGL
jgi:CRP-like cAMP-binding protein